MNGTDHYHEAEKALSIAETTYWEGPSADVEFAQTALMAAQVHATLAAAAFGYYGGLQDPTEAPTPTDLLRAPETEGDDHRG